MSKEEEKYKKYLYYNFNKLSYYLKSKDDYSNNWYGELVSYNNIIGSLIGLIDSKGQGKELQDCKDFILKYYEATYPEKQLEVIDEIIYSKDCCEYIKYASNNLVFNNVDVEILKEFSSAYIKGYNLGNKVSLKATLPYYAKKMQEYTNYVELKEKEKLYKL